MLEHKPLPSSTFPVLSYRFVCFLIRRSFPVVGELEIFPGRNGGGFGLIVDCEFEGTFSNE
jgi:hypothetical protein